MKYFSPLIILATLSACGGSDGSAVGSNNTLMGTWQSNCYAADGLFYEDQYIFNNDTYLLDSITYSDSNCNIQTGVTASYDGSYQIGLNVTASDGVQVTRISMEQVELEDTESRTENIKAVFRVTGDSLSMGMFYEGIPPELNTNISYVKQSNERQLACTQEAVYGINIRVVDNNTEQPSACGASVIITSDDYYQKLNNPQDQNCDDEQIFSGALERKGRYNIIVQKPSFKDWYQNNVVVTANRCHVNGVEITAVLEVD